MIKGWLKNQSILSEHQKKDNSTVKGLQAFKSNNMPQEVPNEGKQAKGKGKDKVQVEQALPTELQNSKEIKYSHGLCVQYSKNSDRIQKQGEGNNESIPSN
ncbi:hypothetical protein O181_014025 [Austropuccinia psidii MF-1]|uniref:Uncharacterized protein n=1 Tax=Austropuccinia psidii MF-1 TaxID=1389203 RepID=A0A9Q3GPI6_9BASI|nr:hypothetical protein [Austropuccinia psidii MF-1]